VPKFHYSSYWGKWSRVLQELTADQQQVEVDLNPINSQWDFPWETTKKINIRSHRTAPGRNDKRTDKLPSDVLELMEEKLGEQLVNRLLNEDFLPYVDWDKYREICNGGACFDDIKKCNSPEQA